MTTKVVDNVQAHFESYFNARKSGRDKAEVDKLLLYALQVLSFACNKVDRIEDIFKPVATKESQTDEVFICSAEHGSAPVPITKTHWGDVLEWGVEICHCSEGKQHRKNTKLSTTVYAKSGKQWKANVVTINDYGLARDTKNI